tara:strand:+ start:553 stop:1017 length:465 start_codon:yes stop_codon:yes gene_type:complete
MADELSADVGALIEDALESYHVPLAQVSDLYQGVVHRPVPTDVAPEAATAPVAAAATTAGAGPSTAPIAGKRGRGSDDNVDPLIKKVRADAPLLSAMDSIQSFKLEFLDGIDDLMRYVASCMYKINNQPLDTHMYKLCFDRLLRTRAFLENCSD